MRRIGWRLMCRSAARRPSWLSQSSGSQPQPGLRRGAVGMGFAQAPLRVQRGGPADRRRGLRRTRTRDAVAQPGPGRQPAVQGQPAIGAGDGMDADAVQAGERAYRRQHGPGGSAAARSPGARPRPPVPPASTRRRRTGWNSIKDSATTHDLYSCNFPDYTSAPVWPGACFQTWRAYPEWAACRWSHALQYRFAGRAANPGGSPHAPSRTALPPASSCTAGIARATWPAWADTARKRLRAALLARCRWPPPRPPRPRPRSGR